MTVEDDHLREHRDLQDHREKEDGRRLRSVRSDHGRFLALFRAISAVTESRWLKSTYGWIWICL